MICGIPDFRLAPDPYIGIEEDRDKGERLLQASEGRSYEEMLRYYYEITEEDPPDLARHWIAHSLAEPEIARKVMRASGLLPQSRSSGLSLLDIGCSTGGLLIAADNAYEELTGLDVAFRWLVLGQVRLLEAGVRAKMVCANAESLPFAEASFDVVTATDLAEHLRDAATAVRETARVLIPGGKTVWTTNNRFALLPDPQIRLWGVGYLPRRWQPAYVALRRTDLHIFKVQPRSAREMRKLFEIGGLRNHYTEAAPIFAPHLGAMANRALRVYNRMRRWPLIAALSKCLGPRLWTLASR